MSDERLLARQGGAGAPEASAGLCFWPGDRRGRLALGLILALALAIRLALWTLPVHQPANDEVEYLAVARDLLAGHGWRFYDHYPWLRAPLYPLFLAGSLSLAGGDAHLATLPAILLSVVTVYLCFLLGQAVSSRRGERRAVRAGLLAALLWASLLTLATFANLWMAETLWSALFVLALLLLLRWAARPRLALVAGAGLVLGLATLTRSLPLLCVPALALWALLAARRALGTRRALAHAALFVASFVLTLAPWSLRSWRAYGAFIPVETGASYNLWAFNEPGLELAEIGRILSAIPNPAERAAYAEQRGMERLRADPAILLRKLRPNMIYLLRVKPIEDRYIRANYYSDTALPYVLAGLLADDLLYLLVLGCAAWALARAPADRRLWLALLWVAYVLAVLALTHGESRYRHFLYPLLIPYAGAALAGALPQARGGRRWLAPAVAVTLGGIVLSLYPWGWAGTNLARSASQALADWRQGRGDLAGALAAEQAALEADPTSSDAWIRVGQAHERLGRPEEALDAYRASLRVHSDYYPAAVRLGALLRSLGRLEEAREVFLRFERIQETIPWAWNNLRVPPPALLDLGSGLDLGFATGVYASEPYAGSSARWTSPEAALRLPAGGSGVLLLRLAAPRPPGAAPAAVRVCLDQDPCVALSPGPDWSQVRIVVPARPRAALLRIQAAPFVPATLDPASPDTRALGLLLDWAMLEPR